LIAHFIVLEGKVGPNSQGRHEHLENPQELSMTLSTLIDTERGLNEGKLYVHVVWSYI
jgi:hypothetical protein